MLAKPGVVPLISKRDPCGEFGWADDGLWSPGVEDSRTLPEQNRRLKRDEKRVRPGSCGRQPRFGVGARRAIFSSTRRGGERAAGLVLAGRERGGQKTLPRILRPTYCSRHRSGPVCPPKPAETAGTDVRATPAKALEHRLPHTAVDRVEEHRAGAPRGGGAANGRSGSAPPSTSRRRETCLAAVASRARSSPARTVGRTRTMFAAPIRR